jgi:inhibitor of KinA
LTANIKIFPIGDSAATIELGNCITEEVNQKILSMNEWLLQNPFNGLQDIVIAYSSLSVFYDPCTVRKNHPDFLTAFEVVKDKLESMYHQSVEYPATEGNDLIRIPVCYDDQFGYDLDFIAAEKGLSKQEIVQLHCSKTYKVYMVGFLPGFAYMGKIDDQLIVCRKLRPEQVAAGSVGITGSQTAVYPANCPGGWHIIGRTPIKLFDPEAAVPIELEVGAYVNFYPVSVEEFQDISQQTLNQ